ncbi:MAG: hypothetical protein ACI8UO_003933 [Verrucomicrobiales bacterium]
MPSFFLVAPAGGPQGFFMKTPLLCLTLIFLTSLAQAHYLWITIDPKEGEHGSADLVFEGGIRPGDGKYIDAFIARGKTWLRTVDKPKYRELEMADTKREDLRWLQGALAESGPRVLESYGRFGVWRYGETDVQLHYCAKHFDSAAAEVLSELGRSKKLELDIVPSWNGDEFQVQVLWRGEPAQGVSIRVRGGGKADLKTDDEGKAAFTPESAGLFQIHTSVDESKSGKEPADDKAFTVVRYHSTLTINLAKP